MQTYNYLANELPRELIEIYNDIEVDILKIIVRCLKEGKREEEVFQEIRDKVDAYNPKVEKVVSIIFADSKKKTVKDNEREFKQEPEDKKPVSNSEANSIIAPALIGGLSVLAILNKSIVNNAVNEYSRDYLYVNNGFGNKEKRMEQVVHNLANKGLTIFESYGGGKSRNFSIESKLRRDVMYKVNQANAKVNKENFNKSSAKFIQVSSHPTARTWNKYMKHPYEDHSSWQGKVYYSRDGEYVEGYQEFESTCGYGEMLGICGINCYHQFQMSYDGDSTATQYSQEQVERDYALSQEQRKYEANIKRLKQQQAVYEEAGNTQMSKALGSKISIARGRLKDFCEKNGLKYYNWRTQL